MNNPIGDAKVGTILDCSQTSAQFGSLLVVSVVASTASFLFLLAPDMEWPHKICLTAIILLMLKHWGCVLVLMAAQTDLFLREPQHSDAFRGFTGVSTVVLIVGLLMFINRNRELLHRAANRPLRSTIQRFLEVFQGIPGSNSERACQEIYKMFTGTIVGLVVLAACSFLSQVLLTTIPDRRTLNEDLQTWMLEESTVLRFSLLLAGIVATWIVCNEVSWRQLTREQAELYMRSVFMVIHHADLRMIVRGRIKRRQKVARLRNDLESPRGVLDQRNYAGRNE
jgi:hypothetical protein